MSFLFNAYPIAHRIHGAAIYGNMDPINITQSFSIYIPYMDPMGWHHPKIPPVDIPPGRSGLCANAVFAHRGQLQRLDVTYISSTIVL